MFFLVIMAYIFVIEESHYFSKLKLFRINILIGGEICTFKG